jgi:hypothetical protein
MRRAIKTSRALRGAMSFRVGMAALAFSSCSASSGRALASAQTLGALASRIDYVVEFLFPDTRPERRDPAVMWTFGYQCPRCGVRMHATGYADGRIEFAEVRERGWPG